MKKFGIALLTAGLLAFTACAAFAATLVDTTVNPQVSNFTGIKIGGPFELHVSQGATESVKFTAPADLVKHIYVEVDHGILKVGRKIEGSWLSENTWRQFDHEWQNRDRIKVYVVVSDLKELTVSGSGLALLEDPISSNTLKLRTRGSGSIAGKINAKFLEGRVSGSGNINISGTAETSAVRVSGSGQFSGKGLSTGVSSVLVSGSGHAEISATNKIDATVHGSGSISYTGNPKSVTRKTSGSGAIQGS